MVQQSVSRIEQTILSNFFYNEEYTRKVIPFVREEYFSNRTEAILFNEVFNFIEKYNNLPTKDAISIELNSKKDINEEEFKLLRNYISTIQPIESDIQWLVDTTEKFCKERAVHNAVLTGIKILDNKDKKQTPEAIPHILSEALAVSFDKSVGHDYIEDADSRFKFYHTKEKKYQFDLDYMNLAGTGVGKSLFMCHCVSAYLTQGLNVLYITLEMSEERIAERIDANLLDVSMEDLHVMPKDMYDSRMKKLTDKTIGKLIIKEYPTASAHSGHFKSLINELALKKSFKPDVVFIDYLNICTSARFKGGNINSYTMIKSIAEELRGLAVEHNVPIFSATQTTRSGFTSTDIGLEDTSESFGLPATADFMFALISNEELEALGQMKVKQLKNRYNDPSSNRSFIIGVDRSKMRLFDVGQAAQNIVDSNQTKDPYEKKEKAYDKFSDFKL